MKLLLMGLFFIGMVRAAQAALEEGAEAPDFTAPATGGKDITLSALRSQWVVLYFYPKADTPGCTKQGCSLRDGYSGLREANAVVLGVSTDGVPALERFKEKYNFPFDLVSDKAREIIKAYGTEKIGGLVAQRKTFIIDPEGRIAHVFDKVNVSEHDKEVLDVLKALQE